MNAYVRRISELYDSRSTIPFDGKSYVNDVSFDLALLEELMGSRPNNLCDMGCGLGWHLEALAARGAQNLWGIDVSAGSLGSFSDRIASNGNISIRIVFGDVMQWGVRRWFDATTSFLSCLGQFSGDGDDAYLRSAVGLLRARGVFLASVFCEEIVDNLVGEWTTSYSTATRKLIKTRVTYDSKTKLLTIGQTKDDDATQVPPEIIQIHSRDELYLMAKKSGLVDVTICLPEEVGALRHYLDSSKNPARQSRRMFLSGRAGATR